MSPFPTLFSKTKANRTGEEARLLLEETKRLLDRATQNPEHALSDGFIVEADLEKIWTESRVKQLLRLRCNCPERSLDQFSATVIEHYLKVISILTYISWTQWPMFLETFMGKSFAWDIARNYHRSDEDLPFTSLDELRSGAFMDTFGSSFYQHQYLFIPVKIGDHQPDVNEDRGSASLSDRICGIYTEHYRLPVIGTTRIGGGASGAVFKETVASGCIALGDDGWNNKGKNVARKHIEAQEAFDTERGVIQHLKNCKLQHNSITKCYGMVVRRGRHKDQLDIFYELASSNLSQFLTSNKMGHDYQRYDFQYDLLKQAEYLAWALAHCHEELYDDDRGPLRLAHNDLKPENILVFYDTKSLAGVFKIADFGLSKVKLAVREGQLLAPDGRTNQSITTARRPPGGYTAPEIVNEGIQLSCGGSLQCDIWSFGCILSEILMYAIGGADQVLAFKNLRSPGNIYDYRDDGFSEELREHGQLRLKEPAFNHLLQVRSQFGEECWVAQFVDLIFDTLGVNKDPANHGTIRQSPGGGRPKASEIRTRLRLICNAQKSQSQAPRVDTPGPSASPSVSQRSVFSEHSQQTSNDGSSITRNVTESSNRSFSTSSQSMQSPPSINLSPGEAFPNLSTRDMKGAKLSPDARHLVSWSSRQLVVRSLATASKNVLLRCDVSAQPSAKIKLMTMFEGEVAISVKSREGTEIRFYSISNENDIGSSQQPRILQPENPEGLVNIFLGIDGTVILWYSDCVRIGSSRTSIGVVDPEHFKKMENTSNITHKPSVSLNGRCLMLCHYPRPVQDPQRETWCTYDIPGVTRATLTPIRVPHPDVGGDITPTLMIPIQDNVAMYYPSGTVKFFDNGIHNSKIDKNVLCAAATTLTPGNPLTALFVYIVEKRRGEPEIYCADIQRSETRISLENLRKVADYPGRIKLIPSMGFSWVSADRKPHTFCLVLATPDGAVRCVELPGVDRRWL